MERVRGSKERDGGVAFSPLNGGGVGRRGDIADILFSRFYTDVSAQELIKNYFKKVRSPKHRFRDTQNGK